MTLRATKLCGRLFLCATFNIGFSASGSFLLSVALGFYLSLPCIIGSRALMHLRDVLLEEERCGLPSKDLTALEFVPRALERQTNNSVTASTDVENGARGIGDSIEMDRLG